MAEVIGIDTHIAVLINYVYELSSYCTSLIAKLNDGTIIHERNLDFTFPDDTRNLTYVAKFYKGD